MLGLTVPLPSHPSSYIVLPSAFDCVSRPGLELESLWTGPEGRPCVVRDPQLLSVGCDTERYAGCGLWVPPRWRRAGLPDSVASLDSSGTRLVCKRVHPSFPKRTRHNHSPGGAVDPSRLCVTTLDQSSLARDPPASASTTTSVWEQDSAGQLCSDAERVSLPLKSLGASVTPKQARHPAVPMPQVSEPAVAHDSIYGSISLFSSGRRRLSSSSTALALGSR